MDILVLISLSVCFLFAFINGFHDGCNVVATIISSRSISPKKALWIACVAEFIGPMVLGTSVATTIGNIVKPDLLLSFEGKEPVLLFLAAVTGAIVWNLLTWIIGMPSSSSHALVGGLLGAGLLTFGVEGIDWAIFLYKVLIVLFTSPLIGFAAGYIFLKVLIIFTRNQHPSINCTLKRIQAGSMFVLGMSHGSNDAQKTMGIAAIILFLSGYSERIIIPLWIQFASSLLIALGLTTGGWKLIKTVGMGIFNLKPIHSFSSQLSSAITIISASLIGGPVSTTQIVNSSVMGVGTAERKNAVRWDNVRNILISWFCTIPASALVAALVLILLKQIPGLQ